jgi:hypothetical protein
MEEHEHGREPFRVRFRVPLSLVPIVIGVAVAIPLWGSHAEPEFFEAATHVLAIGSVALALQGRFFRLVTHLEEGPGGAYVMLNVVGVLVSIGLGLGFSFHALAEGHSSASNLAVTAGALSAGIAAFAVQALFGTPGLREEPETPPAA